MVIPHAGGVLSWRLRGPYDVTRYGDTVLPALSISLILVANHYLVSRSVFSGSQTLCLDTRFAKQTLRRLCH